MAVIVGIVALFAIKSYVNKVEEQSNAKLRGEKVAVASMDIPAGTELTINMLDAREVPSQFIHPQSIKGSAAVSQILGAKTRRPIKAGQPILYSDLAEEKRGGLSTIIPTGDGAYTVAMPKGLRPGLIQPGDRIDIIGSFAVPKPAQNIPNTAATWRQGSDIANVVLLQNVTVLAVGDLLGGGFRSESSSGGDLTLSLTLPEAQLMMFAGQQGELGAILRRDGASDVRTREELPRITFEAIDKIIGDLDDKRKFRMVEVQKGSSSQSVPVANPGGK